MTLRVLADSVVADSDVLAYLPSPPQGVWDLGPFPLRAYALCIIVGIVVAIWWGERRWQARGGQAGTVLDVAMFAVPFGLIGGRLYHVATDYQKYFGEDGNPLDALKIYQGGLGIWGAVFLGGIGAWIGCRVYKVPLPALGDAIAPPILLAQAIGRVGNYFNQELYGRETDLPWGLEIYRRFDPDGKLDMMNGVSTGVVDKVVQPTFLYELVWNVLVVILLVQLDRRLRIGHGRLFALYVALYCVGRFVVELLRDDEATQIAGIRINSFTSALVFLAAIAYVIFATKGRETPESLQPGVAKRPWPWQLGQLRAVGAESEAAAAAGTKTEVAAAEKSEDTAGDVEADTDADGKAESSGTTTPAKSDELIESPEGAKSGGDAESGAGAKVDAAKADAGAKSGDAATAGESGVTAKGVAVTKDEGSAIAKDTAPSAKADPDTASAAEATEKSAGTVESAASVSPTAGETAVTSADAGGSAVTGKSGDANEPGAEADSAGESAAASSGRGSSNKS
ncbi:prolipoprotein diacylglyceryl transferase [Nocardia takedensis]|uniref:prolipoprotein diacylglyceryl transferase n=1 Tax=Nocardia takedensis TaxID=259390 RepID=UPI000A0294DD|nr:prolipoprotein diacylglyceryl transferase [Nocardia takedensis]